MRNFLENGKTAGIVDLGMSFDTPATIAATIKATPICYEKWNGAAAKKLA